MVVSLKDGLVNGIIDFGKLGDGWDHRQRIFSWWQRFGASKQLQ